MMIGGFHPTAKAVSQHLSNRFDELTNASAGATTTHLIGFGISSTSTPLGSVRFQFCSNDPLPDLPCNAPTGFNASSAVLSAQSGNTGFSILSESANEVVLSRSPASNPTTAANTYQLNNVINPSAIGVLYLRLYIYQSTDGSGTETENGGVALSINQGLNVNAEVPPYLGFCSGVTITGRNCASATGYYLNFGEFSTSHASVATSQFSVGTNAGNGYNVTVNGTTLTSGNNVIPSLSSPSASTPGVSQFGLNLAANTLPAIGSDPTGPPDGRGQVVAAYSSPNRFAFNSGDVIVVSSTTSNYQVFTVSYLANISSSQPPGVYASTLTYICLANF
jgi:hypothetical protein